MLVEYLLAATVSVFCGLDRTAALQLMVSRPIVAAPLTGWLLGDLSAGLQVGVLVELLWLGRLPVGAAIPPDDTQVAVASTALAVTAAAGRADAAMIVLAVLVAMPLGKVGQFCERWARQRNGRLLQRAMDSLAAGQLGGLERLHLRGAVHFACASLLTFVVILAAGTPILRQLAPLLDASLSGAAPWLQVALPLVGAAVILGTINVRRSLYLYGVSFASAFLMLWLL